MTEDKDIARAYSQDRHTYRHDTMSINRKTSTQISRTMENYYSNRNCPEILSLFALTNKQLDNRKNQIRHSISNDMHYFNMVNYPIQSPPATPMPNLVLENDNQPDIQTKLPKVTPKITPTNTKKFPTFTPRNTLTVDKKKSMPKIKTSVKSSSLSFNKPLQPKIPTLLIGKK